MENRSLKTLFREVFYFTSNNLLEFLKIVVPFFAILLAVEAVLSPASKGTPLLTVVNMFLLLVLYPQFMGRLIKYMAITASGEEIKANDPRINVDATDWKNLFTVHLVYNTAVALGLLLFIIPGIYLFLRLSFAEFYAIIERKDLRASLEQSWLQTQPWLMLIFSGSFIIALVYFMIWMPLNAPAQDGEESSLIFTVILSGLLTMLHMIVNAVYIFRIYSYENPVRLKQADSKQ